MELIFTLIAILTILTVICWVFMIAIYLLIFIVGICLPEDNKQGARNDKT